MLLDQMLAIKDRPDIAYCIARVAIAGQRAGFTIEEMIEFLRNGLQVETLIDLIAGAFMLRLKNQLEPGSTR